MGRLVAVRGGGLRGGGLWAGGGLVFCMAAHGFPMDIKTAL